MAMPPIEVAAHVKRVGPVHLAFLHHVLVGGHQGRVAMAALQLGCACLISARALATGARWRCRSPGKLAGHEPGSGKGDAPARMLTPGR